jgi:hypothetical protein
MYATQVMSDVQHLIAHSTRNDRNFLYLQVMEQALPAIKSSAKFHIDDYLNMIRIFDSQLGMIGNLFQGSMAERVRPPYPLCWISYEVTPDRMSEKAPLPVSKRAVLITDMGEGLMSLRGFAYFQEAGEHSDRWFMSPLSVYINPGAPLMENPNYNKIVALVPEDMSKNLDEYCTKHSFLLLPLMPMDETQYTSRINELQDAMAVANMFLQLINTPRMQVVSMGPQKNLTKINRKRTKQGKSPLFEYKTLRLTIHGKTEGTGRDKLSGERSEAKAHEVRGHYKFFSDDSPLFGKHTGVFWWTPQVRGKVEKGKIEKEYNLK